MWTGPFYIMVKAYKLGEFELLKYQTKNTPKIVFLKKSNVIGFCQNVANLVCIKMI